MSVPQPCRVSRAARPAWTAVKTLVPVVRASAASAAWASASRRNGTVAPRWEATAGRGRSVGRSSWSGRPARVLRQWSSWRTARALGASPVPRSFACQSTWSANCTVSAGSSGARPARRAVWAAARSRASGVVEAPSPAMWWSSSRRVWVPSWWANRLARSGGSAPRSKAYRTASVISPVPVWSSTGAGGRIRW